MVTRIPPIHCLAAFEAVARLRSVQQAAEELAVTPSAVSHRLRQLDELLGLKLFAKGGEFKLTVEGMEYLKTVKPALDALGRFPARRGPRERALLRLAVTPTFARQILLPRLPDFAEAFPDVELVLQVSIPLLDVTAEDADMEVRYGAGHYGDLESRLLLTDEVVPACSPAFLQEHAPLRLPEDLARLPLLRSPLEPWRTWFAAQGPDRPEPREGPQFNDIGLMLDAAANGQGVALARVKLGRAWFDAGRLVALAEHPVPSPHAHYLCYEKAALERYECAAFADWLQKSLADLPP